MTLYRYDFVNVHNGNMVGLLTGLDDIFGKEDAFFKSIFFEQNLEAPDVDMRRTKSYFTEQGNRKFRKAIRALEKDASIHGYKLICSKKDKADCKEIVYSDKYQVIEKDGR